MTMVKPAKQIAAGEFKATCLRLLDEVAQAGQEYVVTKRGVPVARIVPLKEPRIKREPPIGLKGSVLRFDRPCDPVMDPLGDEIDPA